MKIEVENRWYVRRCDVQHAPVNAIQCDSRQRVGQWGVCAYLGITPKQTSQDFVFNTA